MPIKSAKIIYFYKNFIKYNFSQKINNGGTVIVPPPFQIEDV